ncbi:mechanosensitive ion channel [bacterium]|nr:MAG: mechanosensitive ion channel [bacterium]
MSLIIAFLLLFIPIQDSAKIVTDTAETSVVIQVDSLPNTASVIADSAKTADEGLPSLSEVVSYGKIFWTIVILILTYLITRFVVSVLDGFAERSTNYRLFIKRLVPIIRILIWMLALYFVIEGIIDPPIQTLYTVMASIGLAVGFASQDILKNIFGGFMIILDRPFQVGDKIDIDGTYGEVLQIGLRSTRIVTPDDSVVSVPNSEIMNKAVSNSNSGAIDCQVVSEIYLPVETDIQKAKEIAWLAAATSRYVYLKKPIAIITKNEVVKNQWLIKMRVKAYVLDIRDEFLFLGDMTEIILTELKAQGIIAFQLTDTETQTSK